MNLTGILSTLGTLANAASATSAAAQGKGPSFDQVLSQGMAQRAPQPEPPAPRSPQPQPQTAQQAQAAQARQQTAQGAKSQEAKSSDDDGANQAAPGTQAAQAASAGKGGDAKTANAKATDDTEHDAATDARDALADIPGASQAALMMQLMHDASADAARPDLKLAAKEAPLADGVADPKARGRADILAAADAKTPHAAPDALAAASAGAAAPKTEEGYARLMTDTMASRLQSDAQQAEQQAGQQPLPAAALATALQQTSAAVAATQAPHDARLAPPVGSNAWDNALGQKVVWMASGGEQSASLTLNPPDLGPLQVVLAVNNNHATVNFTASQPEVRQALEAALPRLKEMMSDAGIQLGQANVGAGTQGQSSGFERRNDGGSQRERGADAFSLGAASSTDARVRQGIVRIAPDGAVDTFA